MENTIKPGFTVERKTLNRTLLIITLLVALIYAYFYYLNQDPTTMVDNPLGPPTKPNFAYMIYGGFGEDQLKKPMAVTTIGDKVFVSDTDNRRIQIFEKGGTPVGKFGKKGYAKGEFQFPYGLAGDSKGNLLVADMYTGKISTFTPEGKFIEYFGEKADVGKFVIAPADIKFINNKLYVADVKKARVYVFDKNGKLSMELGKEFKELNSPNGIAVNAKTGEIYVVDSGHDRIVIYDKKGKVLGQHNGSKDNKGQNMFSNPRGIGFDSRGVLYVVSNLTHLIYGYDGKYKELFTFGGMGNDMEKFILPNGLHSDEDGYVYITDTMNARVHVYRAN